MTWSVCRGPVAPQLEHQGCSVRACLLILGQSPEYQGRGVRRLSWSAHRADWQAGQ